MGQLQITKNNSKTSLFTTHSKGKTTEKRYKSIDSKFKLLKARITSVEVFFCSILIIGEC